MLPVSSESEGSHQQQKTALGVSFCHLSFISWRLCEPSQTHMGASVTCGEKHPSAMENSKMSFRLKELRKFKCARWRCLVWLLLLLRSQMSSPLFSSYSYPLHLLSAVHLACRGWKRCKRFGWGQTGAGAYVGCSYSPTTLVMRAKEYNSSATQARTISSKDAGQRLVQVR